MTATDELYAALGQGITSQDPAGLFRLWLDGPLSLLTEVDTVVRDSDLPGWAGQLTAEDTARVRWTAQLLGVTIPDVATDTEARNLIRDRTFGSFRRGTPGALTAAATPLLTGTRRVELIERDGGAYRLTVRTYAPETPDPAAVEAALRAAKPAGLVLTYQVFEGSPYDTRDPMFATYDALDASALTYDDLDGVLY